MSDNNAVTEKPKAGTAVSFSAENMARREAMYDKLNPEPKAPETPKPSDFKPDVPSDKGDKKPAEAVKPADDKPADAPKTELAAKPTEPTAPDRSGEEDTRKVPLKALQEAREEMKSLKKELTDLRDQNKILLNDLKDKFEKSNMSDSEPVISDYDKELLQLRKEIKELREKDSDRDKVSEAEKQRQAQEKMKADLRQTHTDLEKEGFEGFEEFVPLVAAELQRRAAADPDDAVQLDNPEGWKKIFKTVVYPKIMARSKQKATEDKIKEKEELKKDAGLLMPGGAPPVAPTQKEEEYSFEAYLADRNKRSPQPQRSRK